MTTRTRDTIVAIATPPGRGGVGIIRISGPQARGFGTAVTGQTLPERKAIYAYFKSVAERPENPQIIDTGLAIYFAAPRSFTGEDVVELHGHGGPVIQDLLLSEIIALGARQARAGEFSERAFLNDKIDLTQAEAIADLIDSSTVQAARGAMRSLQGEFSNKINDLLKELIHLRMYVEAAIDFPEEEIDFLADQKIHDSIQSLRDHLDATIHQAGQGAILRNGLRVVLAGKPNAGKSSLLNALSGFDAAIVTDIPGTTRDAVTQTIDIDGLPVHVIDTAGLRESDDTVEKIGIARAREAMDRADHILYLLDASNLTADDLNFDTNDTKTSVVYNKVDLLDAPQGLAGIKISATRGDGMDSLINHIKSLAGFEPAGETLFTARRRHLTALTAARDAVQNGLEQLKINNAGELLAEELLQAQNYLNEITGEYSADDLLGEIFAGFCIGK
ncbi:MAG: tRNA uridine-5-carboxymethylaminomethyl(34) synthesis GTPase MnmE [Gammaproteobacteria bacterium]|nr:tRNA uridine-5-carboxymethylaminomethyl(34) synthesis GTPase MnmE [Gammaproteobacteria bacterium]